MKFVSRSELGAKPTSKGTLILIFDTLCASLASNGQDNRVFVSLPFSWSFHDRWFFGQSAEKATNTSKQTRTAENKYICTYLAYSNSEFFFFPSLSFRAQYIVILCPKTVVPIFGQPN